MVDDSITVRAAWCLNSWELRGTHCNFSSAVAAPLLTP
jgi:hypothetical protein